MQGTGKLIIRITNLAYKTFTPLAEDLNGDEKVISLNVDSFETIAGVISGALTASVQLNADVDLVVTKLIMPNWTHPVIKYDTEFIRDAILAVQESDLAAREFTCLTHSPKEDLFRIWTYDPETEMTTFTKSN